MGDVISLVERAQEQYDEDEARKLQKKIAKNQFGFDDFLSQIQQIKKMGSMKDLGWNDSWCWKSYERCRY